MYPELSYQIMEAVFEVHNTLGPGFVEQIYEEALTFELRLREIPFSRQKPVQIYYKGQLIGKHRLDLVIDDKMILELKAVSELTNAFRQQTLSYLRASNLKLGILINFGEERVKSARILNSLAAE
ncbi:MAG: GxxExxY protein [Ardenticatenaceae bacterium]|nr:GxxExxY protein [Ardenticatenaceae bacterium]